MKKLSSMEVHEILKSRVSQRYFEVGDRMVAALPELSAALEDYFANWKLEVEPGPINLTDEIFVPFIEKCLKTDGTKEVLKRAFDFIEELASDPETEIREVAEETISSLPRNQLRDVVAMMGPKSREMLGDDGQLKR